jgi:hypothetical protein
MAMLELALERVLPADAEALSRRLQMLDALCASGEALVAQIAPESLRGEVLSQIREALGRAAGGGRGAA